VFQAPELLKSMIFGESAEGFLGMVACSNSEKPGEDVG
jgi:hypothetical protein